MQINYTYFKTKTKLHTIRIVLGNGLEMSFIYSYNVVIIQWTPNDLSNKGSLFPVNKLWRVYKLPLC